MSMRVAYELDRLRCAFVGSEDDSIHVPRADVFGATRLFLDGPGVAQEVNAWNPDCVIVFNPQRLAHDVLSALQCPSVLAMIGRPVLVEQDAAGLRRVSRPKTLPPIRFTYFDAARPEPVRVLSPVDTCPLPLAPELSSPPRSSAVRAVAYAEWAKPPQAILDWVAARASLTLLPLSAKSGELAARMAEQDALLYWGADPLGALDVLPLLALARGALLVTHGRFPACFGIEPLDEYLPCDDEAQMRDAVALALDHPVLVAPVRVRAWQRAQEAFLAPQVYARLLCDLALLQQAPLNATPSVAGSEAVVLPLSRQGTRGG